MRMKSFLTITGVTLFISLSLIGCGQNTAEQKEMPSEEDSLKTQIDTLNQPNYLSAWLSETIGCDYPIGDSILKEANFNSSLYQTKASNAFIRKIEFKENGKKPEISVSNKLITISFEDDEGYEKYFAKENTFSFTYHFLVGSNGGSSVYDLITQTVKDYPFTIDEIKAGIAEISRDGYGGEHTGHWWQQGKMNLATGKITWGAKKYLNM